MNLLNKNLDHSYGENINILNSNYMNSLLTKLSNPDTHQPEVTNLVKALYKKLIYEVIDIEFEKKLITSPTRMTQLHPENQLTSQIINPDQKAVTVNLARAGTVPSQICYETLNHILSPAFVRQDHIFASRTLNKDKQVKGTYFGDSKISGSIEDNIILLPDPMGATGSTILKAVDFYKNAVKGSFKKIIALHLIVTPEYLKSVTKTCPELIVYACRLDRGLSSAKALKEKPGTIWDEEKGLNKDQYIVPGAGGLGELMNNSYV